MNKKIPYRSLALKTDFYHKVKIYCQKNGMKINEFAEAILNAAIAQKIKILTTISKKVSFVK